MLLLLARAMAPISYSSYSKVTPPARADQSRPGPFGSMKIHGLGTGVPVEKFVDVRLVDPRLLK